MCPVPIRCGAPLRRGGRWGGFLAAMGAVLLYTSPDALAQRQMLHGHVPAATATLQAIGGLGGSRRMDLVIGLPLRNKEALTNLLRELYDPASPNFRQVLDAGPVCRTLRANGGGLSGGEELRGVERIAGHGDASQPDAGGCQRDGGGHPEGAASALAALPAPGGEPDVFRAGCGAVVGFGGAGAEDWRTGQLCRAASAADKGQGRSVEAAPGGRGRAGLISGRISGRRMYRARR